MGSVQRKSTAVVEETMVSLWFLHGTEMTMMIETLRTVERVLTDKNYQVNGANLELSPPKKTWAKRRQCSTKLSLIREDTERQKMAIMG